MGETRMELLGLMNRFAKALSHAATQIRGQYDLTVMDKVNVHGDPRYVPRVVHGSILGNDVFWLSNGDAGIGVRTRAAGKSLLCNVLCTKVTVSFPPSAGPGPSVHRLHRRFKPPDLDVLGLSV